MFQKPFRVKSQTAIKGSDRKKLKSEFGRQYPSVSDDQLALLFAGKDEMLVVKITTHSGDDVVVYTSQKNPIFFEIDRVIYPTVYLLWKFSDLITTLTTWPEVFKRLESGADLMLPGVILKQQPSPTALGIFNKGQGVAVNLKGNKAAVAVGKTLMSNVDMYEAAMRGKGVAILHTYRDHLWAMGDRSDVPFITEPCVTPVTEAANGDNSLVIAEEEIGLDSHELEQQLSGVRIDKEQSETECQAAAVDEEGDTDKTADSTVTFSSNTDAIDNGEASSGGSTSNISSSKDSMDTLLYQCLLYALRTTAKRVELPILTSTFFRNYMIPCCPKGSSLDVKKSSYKKLSKFLAQMQVKGLLKVKELTKGVESVVAIDFTHDELRHFQIPDWPLASSKTDQEQVEDTSSHACYSPPTIVGMYQITAAVLPLMGSHRKGDVLTAQEVRQLVTEYVRQNNLQDMSNQSLVKLDPTLCDAVVARSDYVEVLRWDELVDRCLSKMTAVHQVTFPGSAPQIRRGHIEPIELDVQQRGANKKVTIVNNLEAYGIDIEQFASTVQKGVACSTSVGPQTGKPKCVQVVIQGNQINYIGQLLREKYQLPAKFIRGLEKAPKQPKKKS